MKRLLVCLLPLLLFFLFPLSASASTPEDYLASLQEGLPPLASGALAPFAGEVGEAMGVRHLFETFFSGLFEGTFPMIKVFFSLLGITLFFSLVSHLGDGIGKGMSKVADMVLAVALVLLLYERFSRLFDGAAAYLEELSALAKVSAPVMGGLYLAGGNTALAATSGGVMAALSLFLEVLCGEALLPLLKLLFGFLLVSALGEVRTDGVVSSLRNLYLLLLGFFSVLIGASLSLGNALGAAGDSFSIRTMKFAVGQMLPIVGGTVSGSLGTVLSSVGLIRAGAGATVAAAILLPLLPLLAELFLSRFAVSLLGGVAGLLGAPTPARLFRSFRSLLDLTLAAVAVAGLLFLFIAALFARYIPAVL